MKKLTLSILSLIFLLCAAVGLVGCGKETHTHSFTEQKVEQQYLASEATCTEPAKYYHSCSCGEKGTETFASGNALGHSFTNYVSDNNATCTKDGTKTAKCDRCTEKDTIADAGSKLSHTFDKQITTEKYLASPATCTEAAKYYYSCVCGEKDTETFAYGKAKGHTEVIDNAKAATCTESGLTEGKHCSVCNTVLIKQNVVPAKGHTEVIDNAKAATCTESGLTEGKHCSVCNTVMVKQNVVPAKGHTEVIDNAKEATCTERGLTEGKHCSVCNAVLVKQNVVPAKGHTEVIDNAKEATCTESGLTEGKHCSVCNTVLVKQNVVLAKGHTYSEEWSQSETEHWRVATCGHNVEKDRAKHIFDENKKCTVCDYITVKPLGLELQSSVFDINVAAKTAYLKVANAVEDYDFSDKFTVADGARFDVCTDKQCNNKIASKKSDIVAGDNIFYILVTNGNDVASYTVTIRRRPIYTVTFNTNGGSEVETQFIEEENYATEPATERKGYDFGAWNYDFSSPISQDQNISASWNIITYKIAYKLNGGENAENNPTTYTVEDEITLVLPTKTGYTGAWDNNGKIEQGSVGDITFIASYTINQYNVNVTPSIKNICTINNAGSYDYNSPVSLSLSDIYLGYEFVGWYNDETLLSADNAYIFNVPANDITITAKLAVKEEMQNYNFTSTTDTCKITDVKDTSVTSAIISDYVTSIGKSAFYGCSKLTSITLPFVGGSRKSANDTYQYPFGYIFGMSSYSGGVATKQYYCGSSTSSTTSDTYYIPSSLKSVTITGGNILYGAFYNCSGLTSITIPDSVTSIGEYAFRGCGGLENIYITDIAAWCNISGLSNLMYYGSSNKMLYLNNELITDLVIPDSVTTIGDQAFRGCSGLTSVTIPDSVTSIGDWAFLGCSGLTSITIPDSVTSIGDSAFSGCSGLTEVIWNAENRTTAGSSNNPIFENCNKLTQVTIGENVKTIPSYAFSGCSGLENIYITDIAAWCNISGLSNLMNYGSSNKKLYLNNELVTDLIIPDNVTSIGNYAFYGCSGLTSITIPNSVTSIGDQAFRGCSGLTSVTIPDSVTAIGSYAFRGCSGLTSITIPDGVTSIGDSTFNWCSGLTSITVPDSVTSIGSYAFSGCSGLTSITIPDSVTSIGSYAFSGCSGLTSITIPDSVTSIGYDAFYYCSGLTEVIWNAENCTTAGSSDYPIFKNCNNLTQVTIGENVKTIPSYAFYNCSRLTSITIGNGVTSIGEYAFRGCSGLENIYIIDIAAWCNISGLSNLMNYGSSNKKLYLNNELITDLVIPDGVTSIGGGAFYNCSGLTSITIPDGVTSIGSYAFYGCSGLTSVTIPDGVTSIGDRAFYGCSGLTSVTIPDSVTSIGYDAFYGCSGLTSITLPFIGASKTANNGYAQVFGYIFGYTTTSEFSTVSGATYQYSQFYYDPYNSTFYYHHYYYYIPASLKSVEITGGDIPKNAFYNCSGLTSVTIGNGVTSIGSYAFYNCSGLTSVTIPDGVTSIGSDAFYGCSGLTEVIWNAENCTTAGSSDYPIFKNCNKLTQVTIGENVKTISSYVFYGCSGLENIYITDIAAWCNISGLSNLMNYGSSNKKLYLNNKLITDLVIPDSVTSIGNSAFSWCSGLTSVTIPDSVTSIGNSAFSWCSGLTSVTILDSVTSIGDSAFEGCSRLENIYITDIAAWCNISGLSNLMCYGSNNKKLYLNNELITDLVIPDSVTSIESHAFYDCSGLTSITIPDSITSIGDYAFYGCRGLTEVIWNAESCTSAGSSDYPIFKNCNNLTQVTIGENVKTIPSYAFYNCSRLTSITIGNGVTSIGGSAFRGCSGLTSVTIPDSVTFIGTYAFWYCSGLTSVTIPDSVTSIGSYAFGGCSGLTSITIPDSITSIGTYAFGGCSGLTSVTIPDSVTSIGTYAFGGCSGLTSITIPDSVTSIGDRAFRGCSGLTSITIPDRVTSIGELAFYYCSGLTEVIWNAENCTTAGSLDNAIFENCNNLTQVTIGENVKTIPSYVFFGCSELTSITIPDSVTSIGSYAFSGCSKLTSITLPFVGDSCKSANDTYQYPFGYIFGSSSYSGGVATKQYYYGSSTSSTTSDTYYIPSSLKSVTITGGKILYGAFYNCSRLTSITIPASVTSIGGYAFYGCSGLTSVTIPDSVISIGYDAFYNCSGLTSVTIPASVTSIGSSAFYGCSGLTSIEFKGTKTRWYAITKNRYWNDNTGKYTVYCTDGTISK